MIELDFSFEESPWESYLRTKQSGDKISAVTLLTILEGESEQALENALEDLETGCMILDISTLPGETGSGEGAIRLRREKELAKHGLNLQDLEETDPLRLYLEEVAAMPAFGDEELLARQCAAGNEDAMVQLTNLGLPRVIDLALEHVGRGVLLLDLIQEGSLGLWQAIRNFRGGEYGEYRDRWIRFYMAKVITVQARNNGVGRKMRTALEDYRSVDERLLSELGRNPTLEEIARELHMGVEETAVIKGMLENARLLAQATKPEEQDAHAEEDDQAVEDTAYFRMRQRIAELLSDLEPEEAALLKLRFGLEGGKPMTPEETGSRLGLTPEEVVAREATALTKLRNRN